MRYYSHLSIPNALRGGLSETSIAVRASEHAPILTDWWKTASLEKKAAFAEACSGKDAVSVFLEKFADDMGYEGGTDVLDQPGGRMLYNETPNPNMNLLDLLHGNVNYSDRRAKEVESAATQAFDMNENKMDPTSNMSTGTTAP
jgi:hypothetical protein